MSQITTHILDTGRGCPAADIAVRLEKRKGAGWTEIAKGRTNQDGRIPNLLPEGQTLQPDVYKIIFETGDYYARLQIKTFYPRVEIIFDTFDTSHYHVPLLLSPFGYSTYRGS